MGTRVTELRCKEVINITDGQRLGFVSDVEVQLPEGKVLALVVPLFWPVWAERRFCHSLELHPPHRLRHHPGRAGAGQMPRSPSKTQVVLTLPGHMPPAKAALPWIPLGTWAM